MGDMTALSLVRSWLRLETDQTGDNDLIDTFIDGVEKKFKTISGRALVSASFTEVVNGKNTASVGLINTPITAVASVTVGGVTIPSASTATDFGYQFSETRVYILNANRGFTTGNRNISIVYTGGYSGAAMPNDLREAALVQVIYEYKKRDRIGESDQNLGDGQTIKLSTDELLPQVKETVMRYRKIT